MKILFISDIHGNYPALLSLCPFIQNADMTICLGDIVGYHCYVNEVVDFIRCNNIRAIQGNHDRYVFEGLERQTKHINDSVRFGIEIAQKRLNSQNKKWLQELPTSFSFKIDDCEILCCHGSPWDPTNEYIYPNSTKFHLLSQFSYNLIALGHTHRELSIRNDNQLIINPGSVGQARDFEGRACAKIVDTSTLDCISIRQKYDFNQTIQDSLSNGAKDWIYKHFQTVIE